MAKEWAGGAVRRHRVREDRARRERRLQRRAGRRPGAGPYVPGVFSSGSPGSFEFDKRRYLAAFCEIGIRPWEIDRLSVDEFESFLDYFEEKAGG
jgi:hypothetical protein